MFTVKELAIMDAPTADNDVVLASLGGKPRMQGNSHDEEVKSESRGTNQSSNDRIEQQVGDQWSAVERGVPREGLRERGGGWKEA